MSDFYEVLSVPRTAKPDEIKKAYLRLARDRHPDRFQDAVEKERAQEFFKELTEAFNTLGNEKSRRAYDAQLEKPQPKSPEEFATAARNDGAKLLEQGQVRSLGVDEIRWMELPDRNRPALLLHGFSERHLLHRRLHGLLTDLPPGRMLRCHPRVAVAPAHVLEALPRGTRSATLLLDNGTRLACGTQFWPAWQKALQALGRPAAAA